MYNVPAVRQTPLWLIFVGLLVLGLAPQPAFRVTSHSMTSRGCKVESLSIGSPAIYTIRQSSCSGRTTVWHWGSIGAVGGAALTVATLVTNALSGWYRGVGGRQQWLGALIIALSLGGLAAFSGGLGSSIDCHSPEGLCAWPFIIFGGIGAVAAVIGVGTTIAAWKNISAPIRAVGLGTIPAMLALWIIGIR